MDEPIFGPPNLDTGEAAEWVAPTRKQGPMAKSTKKVKTPSLVNEPTDEESEEMDIVPLSDAFKSAYSEETDKEKEEEAGEDIVEVSSKEESTKGEFAGSDQETNSSEGSDYPFLTSQLGDD